MTRKHERILSSSQSIFFFFFWSIRVEQLNLQSYSSQAKIVGTVLSISGAIVATLYNGPSVTILSDSSKSLYWIIGGILLASQNFLLSFVLVSQVPKL